MKNELKLNVYEKQDAINNYKDYCDIDDTEPPWKYNAVCKICTQPFALTNVLKTYSERYTMRLWNYCGQMFK